MTVTAVRKDAQALTMTVEAEFKSSPRRPSTGNAAGVTESRTNDTRLFSG